MWQAAATRYAIGLDLADLDLRDALAEALAAQPALTLATGGGADAVISDHGAVNKVKTGLDAGHGFRAFHRAARPAFPSQ